MIPVTARLYIDEQDLSETFIRASGPGGQNVNKVATAVQLRYRLNQADLPEDVKTRLRALAGRRLTSDGELLIEANRFRTQERNREDARARLVELVRRAAEPPKPRKATRPTLASKRRRLEAKTRRAAVKAGRGRVDRE